MAVLSELSRKFNAWRHSCIPVCTSPRTSHDIFKTSIILGGSSCPDMNLHWDTSTRDKWQERSYMGETSTHLWRLECVLNGPSGEQTVHFNHSLRHKRQTRKWINGGGFVPTPFFATQLTIEAFPGRVTVTGVLNSKGDSFAIDPMISPLKMGQFYSHAYINTRETWTHGKQPKAFFAGHCKLREIWTHVNERNLFYMGGDLNARNPT